MEESLRVIRLEPDETSELRDIVAEELRREIEGISNAYERVGYAQPGPAKEEAKEKAEEMVLRLVESPLADIKRKLGVCAGEPEQEAGEPEKAEESEAVA